MSLRLSVCVLRTFYVFYCLHNNNIWPPKLNQLDATTRLWLWLINSKMIIIIIIIIVVAFKFDCWFREDLLCSLGLEQSSRDFCQVGHLSSLRSVLSGQRVFLVSRSYKSLALKFKFIRIYVTPKRATAIQVCVSKWNHSILWNDTSCKSLSGFYSCNKTLIELVIGIDCPLACKLDCCGHWLAASAGQSSLLLLWEVVMFGAKIP